MSNVRAFTNNALLDAASADFLARGRRLLQGFRLAPDEGDHAAALLRLMDPPQGALIADLGCGFGEFARLMHDLRPDLRFALLNANRFQLANAPRGEAYWPILADMQATPIAPAMVDGVMFAWSLCHADLAVALAEAARITRPGGFLFVFDSEAPGDQPHDAPEVSARWHPRAVLAAAAEAAGWRDGWFRTPEGSDAFLRAETQADPALYARVFGGLRPVVWRMVKDPAFASPAAIAARFRARRDAWRTGPMADYPPHMALGLNAALVALRRLFADIRRVHGTDDAEVVLTAPGTVPVWLTFQSRTPGVEPWTWAAADGSAEGVGLYELLSWYGDKDVADMARQIIAAAPGLAATMTLSEDAALGAGAADNAPSLPSKPKQGVH